MRDLVDLVTQRVSTLEPWGVEQFGVGWGCSTLPGGSPGLAFFKGEPLLPALGSEKEEVLLVTGVCGTERMCEVKGQTVTHTCMQAHTDTHRGTAGVEQEVGGVRSHGGLIGDWLVAQRHADDGSHVGLGTEDVDGNAGGLPCGGARKGLGTKLGEAWRDQHSHSCTHAHSRALTRTHAHSRALTRTYFYYATLSHSLTLAHTRSHSLTLAHTRSHSLTLAHTRSHSLTLAHTRSHSLTLAHTRSHSLTLAHTRSHSLTLAHTRSHSLTLAHTRSHSLTLAHTRSHSLTHTYTHLSQSRPHYQFTHPLPPSPAAPPGSWARPVAQKC